MEALVVTALEEMVVREVTVALEMGDSLLVGGQFTIFNKTGLRVFGLRTYFLR
jgi:hypothetical protein